MKNSDNINSKFWFNIEKEKKLNKLIFSQKLIVACLFNVAVCVRTVVLFGSSYTYI